MKTVLLFLVLFLTLAVSVYAQEPDRGDLSLLKGMTKVYLKGNAEHYKAAEKELAKRFTVVNTARDAQFYFDCRSLNTRVVPPSGMSLETAECEAYVIRDNKVIVWSHSNTDGAFGGVTAKNLAKRFVKDFVKFHENPK